MKVWLLVMLCCASAGAALPVATKDVPWVNSLGMKFVPVTGTDVLFSIWNTRVQDFEAFVNATGYDATKGVVSFRAEGKVACGDTWKSPGFTQGPTHPVYSVSWEDAKAFCKWLTQRERAAGRLAASQEYRLPTDAEWSAAVGLGTEPGTLPKHKNLQIRDVYPWGAGWPPPPGAGNYAGEELKFPNRRVITGYNDGFPHTSPVGSFDPNRFGLYDMGGNVWQWCEDAYQTGDESRVTRGAAWFNDTPSLLLSSKRGAAPPTDRCGAGFRCVLAPVGSAQRGANVALGKPVRVTTNGAETRCRGAGNRFEAVTDGSLLYRNEPPGEVRDSDGDHGGCVGWVNDESHKELVVAVTIDLEQPHQITRIRYNMGNCQRAETWGADTMTTPLGTVPCAPGRPYLGAWTEQSGSTNASTVTVVLKKTRTSYATDWLFVGEIEVIGTPVARPQTVAALPPVPSAVKPLPPEQLRQMPPFWTYVAFADADGSADLRGVFEAERLDAAKFQVKLLAALSSAGWDIFPNADQNGQELAAVAQSDDRLVRLYSRLSHWATLDTQSLRFARTANAPWKHAAVCFRHSNTVFQVLVLEQTLTRPWPLLKVPRERGLEFGAPERFRASVRPELAAQLRLRAATSPRRTAWRLGASGLAEFAGMFPQETAAAQRAGVMDARGAMAPPPVVDCDWLSAAVNNRLRQPASPKATTAPVAAGYSPFTALRELETMGVCLLREDCPEGLKSFSGYLRKAGVGSSWDSYLDYLDQIVQVAGVKYSLSNTATGSVTTASDTRQTRPVIARSVSDFEMDSMNRYLGQVAEGYGRWRAQIQAVKKGASDISDCFSECSNISDNMKSAAHYAARTKAGNSRVLSNSATQVKLIGARWEGCLPDIRRAVEKERILRPQVSPPPAPGEDAETRHRRQIAEAARRIPNSPAALGRMTLEMEIASGLWWSIIVFAETSP